MTRTPGDRIFTRDFCLDALISAFCSLNYFCLLINIVGFATSTFGATSAESGLAAGIYVIGGLVARLLLGKYIELVGRRRMLMIGIAFALVMSATYFLVSSLAMLYVVRFLHGMSYGLTSTATGDIVARLVPASRRGEGLGYFYLSITASSAVGPLLGMSLGATGHYDAVFAVGLAMYSLALLCALFIRVPEETLTPEQAAKARGFDLRNLLQLSAIPLAATCMVFYLSYSGVVSFISSYAEEVDMVTAATYLFLAVSAGTFISRLTTGRIFDARGPDVVMFPGFLIFMLGMLVFSRTSSDALFLCAGFAMGYGVSIIYSVCQAIVVSRSPPHRYGVTTSTFAATVDLGSGMGPMILGSLIPFTGYRDMYLLCVGIAAVSLVMYVLIRARGGTVRG